MSDGRQQDIVERFFALFGREEIVGELRAVRQELSELRAEVRRTSSGTEMPAVLTLAQAAPLLGVKSEKTVRSYIRRGLLRAERAHAHAPYTVTLAAVEECRRGLVAEIERKPSADISPEDRALAILAGGRGR